MSSLCEVPNISAMTDDFEEFTKGLFKRMDDKAEAERREREAAEQARRLKEERRRSAALALMSDIRSALQAAARGMKAAGRRAEPPPAEFGESGTSELVLRTDGPRGIGLLYRVEDDGFIRVLERVHKATGPDNAYRHFRDHKYVIDPDSGRDAILALVKEDLKIFAEKHNSTSGQ